MALCEQAFEDALREELRFGIEAEIEKVVECVLEEELARWRMKRRDIFLRKTGEYVKNDIEKTFDEVDEINEEINEEVRRRIEEELMRELINKELEKWRRERKVKVEKVIWRVNKNGKREKIKVKKFK